MMHTTHHFQQRVNQRGISQKMIDCVLQFGLWKGDKCLISRKLAQALIGQWQTLLQDPKRRLKTELLWSEAGRKEQEAWLVCMKKIADKGGVVVVMSQGVLITSYNYMYWSSCAGHFYLRIFILQWAHPIVGCMRPFKIVIMNELRDFLFNSVFIHSRSVT